MAQLLAIGTTELTSDPITLPDGVSCTVSLKQANSDWPKGYLILRSVHSGEPTPFVRLDNRLPVVRVTGPLTFHAHRPLQDFAVGADETQ